MKQLNTKFITAAAISIVAGIALIPGAYANNASNVQIAQAEESNYPVLQSYGPAKTRAEVKRELKEAYEKGLMSVSDSDYPILPQEKNTKTREQIKQELEQSRRNGESKRIDRELYSG
ncbi:DUF4148 domain-containing protein [Herminiimonas glaciei]|uniref:DUF4148 domain-containing protein n=1 Tax=Herminiimonas glaciei TaxID=523788 RepID=A0ABW2I777_9BURK